MPDPAPHYYAAYLVPGAELSLWRNQGWRDARCLAVTRYRGPRGRDDRSADVALVEYVMPNGTSALNLIPADRPDVTRVGRQLPYKRLGRAWLEQIIAAGLTWVGRPQRSTALVLSPAGMLARYDQQAAARREARRDA